MEASNFSGGNAANPRNTDRIVLNIPHSSARFPEGSLIWEGEIGVHVKRWTDWHTDELFAGRCVGEGRVIPVIFPWSRFFCDAERLENDPMESIGQGITYSDFEECHRELSASEKECIFTKYYLVHRQRLMDALTPTSFLVDCHSFPADLSPVEVCIGINEDWSTPDGRLVSSIRDIFSQRGYLTMLNEPYSNSISPLMPFPYPSMMIELNKGTYMNADGKIDRAKSPRIIEAIDEVYRFILGGNH